MILRLELFALGLLTPCMFCQIASLKRVINIFFFLITQSTVIINIIPTTEACMMEGHSLTAQGNVLIKCPY